MQKHTSEIHPHLALCNDVLHDEDEEKTDEDDELREWIVDRYVVLVLDLIQQMVHGLLDVGKEVHDTCGEEHLRERQCLLLLPNLLTNIARICGEVRLLKLHSLRSTPFRLSQSQERRTRRFTTLLLRLNEAGINGGFTPIRFYGRPYSRRQELEAPTKITTNAGL